MFSLAELLNGLGQELLRVLGPLSLEMVILTVVILAAIRLMRVRSPALRHLFWLLLLLKPLTSVLIASPATLYTFARPYLTGNAPQRADDGKLTILPRAPLQTSSEIAPSETLMPWGSGRLAPDEDPSFTSQRDGMLRSVSASEDLGAFARRATRSPASGRLNGAGYVAVLWVIGACALAVRLLVGTVWSHILTRRCSSETGPRIVRLVDAARSRLRVLRRVRVRLCPAGTGPAVFGIVQPTILLPCGLVGDLADRELEMVLAHEVAHVRRHDNFFLRLYRCVEIVLYFHPCVWLCGRALRKEADAACDDAVMRAYGDPDGYADSLTRVAEARDAPRQFALASTLMAVESNFAQRVRRALQGGPQRMSMGSLTILAATLVAIAAVGLPRSAARIDDRAGVRADRDSQHSSGDGGSSRAQRTAPLPPRSGDVATSPGHFQGVMGEADDPLPTEPVPKSSLGDQDPEDAIDRMRSWTLGAGFTMSPQEMTLAEVIEQIVILGLSTDPDNEGIPILLDAPYATLKGSVFQGLAGAKYEVRQDISHLVTFEFERDHASVFDILKFVSDLVRGELRVETAVVISPRDREQEPSEECSEFKGVRWEGRDGIQMYQRLRAIEIPQVAFQDAALPDVVSMIIHTAREVDPNGRGVYVALDPAIVQAQGGRGEVDAGLLRLASQTVTFDLRRVSVDEVLSHVAELIGATLRVKDAIILGAKAGTGSGLDQ